ncbi:MAG: hypothetical protein JHC33_09080 [Ignisphaera sp.]|nr:hypothetical protein [Ignisphaera sp.]
MATITALAQLANPKSDLTPLLMACRDAYNISNTQYAFSIEEGQEIINLYNNRQYTAAQLQKIADNGQPAETFNIIKMLSNAIIGYLDTVVNDISVEPRYMSSPSVALLLNDIVKYVLDENDFETLNKRLKLDGLLTGLMVIHEDVVDTGIKDKYGRKIYEIKLAHKPSWQVRLDPQSILDDYSDARYIHEFSWMPEEKVVELFGKDKMKKLTEYYNYLDGDTQAMYERQFTAGRDLGRYKQYNNYLIVKTIIQYKGKVYSVIWHDEVMLEKKEITFKNVRFPYRIIKLSSSDTAEYYGPFRDISETQKAINQALLQIQLLVNTSKAFVEDNAVYNLEEFRELFGRVNAVIPVTDLNGVRVEDMSRDIQQQYVIIDQALNRIKMVLGINDSFLGSTFASDSGRKVALNQASSASQLTMIVDRIAFMYKMIGEDIVGLVKQYYRAQQVFRIADTLNTEHYIEVNVPIQMPKMNMDGSVSYQPVMDEEIDPETGKPLEDEYGNIIVTPINDPDTALEFANTKIKVKASRAQNSEERNQLLLETVLNGPAGQILMQTNPAAYIRTLAMQVSEFGTKHSIEIARLMMETAIGIEQGKIDPRLAQVGGDLQAIMGAAMGGSTGNVQNMPSQGSTQPSVPSQGPQSPTLGIPKPGREGGRP